jgi:hypothetical protein
MSRRFLIVVPMLAVLAGAGCSFKHESNTTSPSNASAQLLGGVWATKQSFPGLGSGSVQDSCTDFKWQVTDFSGSAGSGTFSATCLNGMLNISGSARGTLSGTTVNWTATATATGAGVPTGCAISLAGTAALDGNQIRIPYSGTTCLGPVSGTEILGKS